MSEKIWEAVVEALMRLQIETDREQAKAKAEAKAEAARIAKDLVSALWDVEIGKSTEEAMHNNMHPQRWA